MRFLMLFVSLLIVGCSHNPLGLDFLELDIPVENQAVYTISLIEK